MEFILDRHKARMFRWVKKMKKDLIQFSLVEGKGAELYSELLLLRSLRRHVLAIDAFVREDCTSPKNGLNQLALVSFAVRICWTDGFAFRRNLHISFLLFEIKSRILYFQWLSRYLGIYSSFRIVLKKVSFPPSAWLCLLCLLLFSSVVSAGTYKFRLRRKNLKRIGSHFVRILRTKRS